MALKCMADNNVNITCQEDARMYDYLAGQNSDYIMKNIGDELKITHSTTTLLVTLGSGEGVLQGRHISNSDSSSVKITLSQNTTAYLVIRYDLTQSIGNEVKFMSTSVFENDDLNNKGLKRDLVLAKYTTDQNGISSLIDMRNFTTNNDVKSITKDITINPIDWQAGIYTYRDSLVTTTSNQEFILPANSSKENTEALQRACLIDNGQDTGLARIKCGGAIPTITVNLRVILRGEK